MQPEQKHTSADGKLILLAWNEDNDWIVGFEGSAWHTHGDVLVPVFGKTEDEAIDGFVRAVLADQLVIGILPIDGMEDQVFITNCPEEDLQSQKSDTPALVLRYWSGKKYIG